MMWDRWAEEPGVPNEQGLCSSYKMGELRIEVRATTGSSQLRHFLLLLSDTLAVCEDQVPCVCCHCWAEAVQNQ